MVDPKLDCYAQMIKVQRDRNVSWDRINYLAGENEPLNDDTLESKILMFVEYQDLPPITCEEWHALVEQRRASEDSGVSIDDGGLYVDFEPNNEQLL